MAKTRNRFNLVADYQTNLGAGIFVVTIEPLGEGSTLLHWTNLLEEAIEYCEKGNLPEPEHMEYNREMDVLFIHRLNPNGTIDGHIILFTSDEFIMWKSFP